MASFTSPYFQSPNSEIYGQAIELSITRLDSPHLYRAGAHPVTTPPATLMKEVSHFSDDEDDLTWSQKLRSSPAIPRSLGDVSKILSYKPRSSSVSSSSKEQHPRPSNASGLGRSFRSQSQSSLASPMKMFKRNVSSSTINDSGVSDDTSSPVKPDSLASTPSSISLSPSRPFNAKTLKPSPVSPIVRISRRHPKILKPSIYDQFDFGFPLQDHAEEDEEQRDDDERAKDPLRKSPISHSH